MEAAYYISLEENKIRCKLCPHNCLLNNGETGKCRVRHNADGRMHTDVYDMVSALAIDPVEKKPLYHFYPGMDILSVGSFGCNMSCAFCQNHEISQPAVDIMNSRKNRISTAVIVKEAEQAEKNIGLAFTYNEPIVWYEFMMELAVMAKKTGMSTVMVSNGYINRAPMKKLLEAIDAFNIDLKAFNDNFYRQYTGASIKPVLDTLKDIKTGGRHLEITFLVIPGYNDKMDEFRNCVSWINDELGPDTVLHLSRYFPSYNFSAPPTPASTLHEMYDIASEKLHFVYPGNINIPGIMDTKCPACGTSVTSRRGYGINHLNTSDGTCAKCGHLIYRHFSR
ncbi:MAG: AmmeMemoRadiSam system radical SAM enzyme [Bacteroidales bacterium]|nr:AmmeMemoRadiSam system radical SAM enzyme [Bacteroidales bacterium]